jgi:hypothetical protein
MNRILFLLDNWCQNNGLQINYSKTEYMIFSKKPCFTDRIISVNNSIISRVKQFKYLGVIFDEKLNFKSHAELVEAKVCVAIGGIKKLKRFYNTKVLALLINTYILSITDYCLPIWGWAVTKEIEGIQNKVNSLLLTHFHPSLAKYHYKRQWAKVSKLPKSEQNSYRKKCHRLHAKISRDDLLERCGLLTIKERLMLTTAKFVFKSLKFVNPVVELQNFFELTQTRSYHVKTRSCTSKGLIQPTMVSGTMRNSIKFSAVKLWNSLPYNIRDTSVGIETFSVRVQKYLIKNRNDIYVSQ